jgi:hypothetical protein
VNARPWFGPLPSLLLALGCGGASIEVLPAPLGAESYALSAERQWICAETADRDQRKLWGLGITAAGSLAPLVSAAWLTDQGARGDRVEAGWVAATVAGAGTIIGGSVLLYTAAAQDEDIERTRLSYARRLRRAGDGPATAVYCDTAPAATSAPVPPPPTTEPAPSAATLSVESAH